MGIIGAVLVGVICGIGTALVGYQSAAPFVGSGVCFLLWLIGQN